MSAPEKMCILFDVDGTLTLPRKVIDPDMLDFLLNTLKPKYTVGLVGGSDLVKIQEQMGGPEVIAKFDYVFAENGLVAFKNGVEIARKTIQDHVGEQELQKLINFCLQYMSTIELPVKRGTFIEFRTGMLNVCPVGRSCSQKERDDFEKYDKEHQVRQKFIDAIRKEFPTLDFTYSIGGQISFDVFPTGWDKTYCLKFLKDFETIHFFGDKTSKGGNDHEIFKHSATTGHTVKGPEDTKAQLVSLFQL